MIAVFGLTKFAFGIPNVGGIDIGNARHRADFDCGVEVNALFNNSSALFLVGDCGWFIVVAPGAFLARSCVKRACPSGLGCEGGGERVDEKCDSHDRR